MADAPTDAELIEACDATYNRTRTFDRHVHALRAVVEKFTPSPPVAAPPVTHDMSPMPSDYGGEPRPGCGLDGAHAKIEWIANTLYAMRHMKTLDSVWSGQLITMAATAAFLAKQVAAAQPQPQPAQPLTGAIPLDERVKSRIRGALRGAHFMGMEGLAADIEGAIAAIEEVNGITAPSTPTPPEVAP